MSGETITQKIMRRASGRPVEPGDVVSVTPDSVLINEILGMVIIPKYQALGARRIDQTVRPRILTILDHGGIGTTPQYVEMHQQMIGFCEEHRVRYFQPGEGICHLVFAENGGALPGFLVLGTDSHTSTSGAYNTLACGLGASAMLELLITGRTGLKVPETIRIDLNGALPPHVYAKDVALSILGRFKGRLGIGRALEYHGDGIGGLSVPARSTLCNMGVEGGAAASVFPCDETLETAVRQAAHGRSNWCGVGADEDASYLDVLSLDLASVEPTAACPHSPDRCEPVESLDVEIDQVFIGSCTNGSYEDLEIAAGLLEDRKVRVLTVVAPGTHEIYRQCARSGLLSVLADAGCRVLYPSCHACFGGPVGLLGPGQRAASTTNRNYPGRMGGDRSTEVYLVSPATAAASAITGRLTHPGEI